ncbi:MAG TPA: 4Fe-4S double cluster binding domain-containing protein [Patescibacteria group bacterium]|nr:4Fe-4S double cluster binding domain-containing protein [Patescibacteria group bacterium]
MKLEEQIQAKALELGYDACGIIQAGVFKEFLAQINKRSEIFPHAAAFYDQLRRLANPRESLDWSESIIVCLRQYDKYHVSNELEKLIGKVFLVDGRMKYSQEFATNTAFEQYLQQLGMRTAQNAAPARWSAVKAGLGKFRDNNFLYTQKGSWVWVDTWVVDQKLSTENSPESHHFGCPEGCQKCVAACPTGALSAPLTMDATKCIAFLTFRSEAAPAEALLDKMGTNLYGCDICQNVCPANAGAWQEGQAEFPEPWPLSEVLSLEQIFQMDQEIYETKLQPRFWYIAKEDYWFWKCKAIRAMANLDPVKYREYFVQALADPHERVRNMAHWALEQSQFEGSVLKFRTK